MNRKERRRQQKQAKQTPPGSSAGRTRVSASGGVSQFLMRQAGVGSAPGEQQRLTDRDADALLIEGEKYHRGGDLAQALALYRQVLGAHPDHSRALTLTGLLAHQRGDFGPARQMLERSLEIDPSDAVAHNAYGNTLRRLNEPEKAIEHFKRALDLDPGFSPASNNIGLTYRQQGDLKQAAEWFRKALKANPEMAETWSGLARTGRMTLDQEEADAAERVLTSPRLDGSDKRHIRYALGKHYDEKGDFDKAMGHFVAANQLREAEIDTERPTHLMKKMVGSVPQASAAPDSNDPVPVFIFGMPRSGTTLVEQILATHPDVAAGGEINVIEKAVVEAFPTLPECDETSFKGVAGLDHTALSDIRNTFFKFFSGFAKGKSHVTDKSPFNFLYLGIISRAFPDARLIHCVRDPLDTCLSIFFTDFDRLLGITTDLGAIGHYYAGYRDMMGTWPSVLDLPVHELAYEALLDDQEAVTRELLKAAGLSWNDACLRFFENKRLVSTPSDWQVRQPLYADSRGRAENYAAHLKPLKQALGMTG